MVKVFIPVLVYLDSCWMVFNNKRIINNVKQGHDGP